MYSVGKDEPGKGVRGRKLPDLCCSMFVLAMMYRTNGGSHAKGGNELEVLEVCVGDR